MQASTDFLPRPERRSSPLRGVAVALCLLLAVTMTGASPAVAATSPTMESYFNTPYPWGSKAQRLRIINRINAAITNTPKRSTTAPNPIIIISTFLLDKADSVDALIAACRRGVSVRVIMDADIEAGNAARLTKALNGDNRTDTNGNGRIDEGDAPPKTGKCGSDLPAARTTSTTDPLLSARVAESDPLRWGGDRSYAKKCAGSCRGPGDGGNVHSKFFLFSRTGTHRNVVMTSSSNLNRGGANTGWNDLMVFNERPAMFDFYSDIHRKMTDEDVVGDNERPQLQVGPVLTRFFPWRGISRDEDPVVRDIRRIKCTGGAWGRTTIHVSMFYWSGRRGEYIAEELLNKARNGCRVSVVYGAPSPTVAGKLRDAARAGRITLYDSRWDFDEDGHYEIRTHGKYILVKGKYGDDAAARMVMTGSANWVSGSLNLADEVTVNVKSASRYASYLDNWQTIVAHSRRIPQ